jgi:hypothetical protein
MPPLVFFEPVLAALEYHLPFWQRFYDDDFGREGFWRETGQGWFRQFADPGAASGSSEPAQRLHPQEMSGVTMLAVALGDALFGIGMVVYCYFPVLPSARKSVASAVIDYKMVPN